MTSTGIIPRSSFKYRAHWRFTDVWKRHHGGRTFYQRDLGPVTVIVLDPLVKWRRGVLPRVAGGHVRRLETWSNRPRPRATGVIVQSEIPAVGP